MVGQWVEVKADSMVVVMAAAMVEQSAKSMDKKMVGKMAVLMVGLKGNEKAFEKAALMEEQKAGMRVEMLDIYLALPSVEMMVATLAAWKAALTAEMKVEVKELMLVESKALH